MNAQKTAKKLGHATNYGDKAVPEPNQSIAEQKIHAKNKRNHTLV